MQLKELLKSITLTALTALTHPHHYLAQSTQPTNHVHARLFKTLLTAAHGHGIATAQKQATILQKNSCSQISPLALTTLVNTNAVLPLLNKPHK